jgi:hypothetical protein
MKGDGMQTRSEFDAELLRKSAECGVSVIADGPLVDVCLAVNEAVRTPDGMTNYCILASAALHDILQAMGYQADVLRVEAAVFNQDGAPILGGDGDGTRRPAAKPGHWRGHLVAVANRRYLLDATLDQAGSGATPIVIEFPSWWIDIAHKPIFVPLVNGGMVRYVAFPGRGGYKSAPDFRPRRRRSIVDAAQQILANGRVYETPSQQTRTATAYYRKRSQRPRPAARSPLSQRTGKGAKRKAA